MPPEAIGEAIAKAIYETAGRGRRGEIGIDLSAASPLSIADGTRVSPTASHRRWEIYYVDKALVSKTERQGFIYLPQDSRWITVRDDEHDILAGTYLQQHELPKEGGELEIDGYRVFVQSPRSSRKIDNEKATVCVDLTTKSTRFGGRFWVLVDQDEEDEDREEMDNPSLDDHERYNPNLMMPATVIHGSQIASNIQMVKKKMGTTKGGKTMDWPDP
ncbi:hypothetical protein ZWY2020_014856 [Hordeum vulgare]|nr:hypothetical protein ZWY2020_014856 [Hordeum vulgare]